MPPRKPAPLYIKQIKGGFVLVPETPEGDIAIWRHCHRDAVGDKANPMFLRAEKAALMMKLLRHHGYDLITEEE